MQGQPEGATRWNGIEDEHAKQVQERWTMCGVREPRAVARPRADPLHRMVYEDAGENQEPLSERTEWQTQHGQ